MAWFRWHEGTCSDSKFHLIARKSGQPVAFALAIWAMLLERASAANTRGNVSGFDCESADAALGMPEGATQAIYEAMVAKGMIVDVRIAKWEEQGSEFDDWRLEISPAEWKEIRLQVFKRDNFICQYCGKPIEKPDCDHVIPVSKGGLSIFNNLVTACPRCNRSKGSKTLNEWKPQCNG